MSSARQGIDSAQSIIVPLPTLGIAHVHSMVVCIIIIYEPYLVGRERAFSKSRSIKIQITNENQNFLTSSPTHKKTQQRQQKGNNEARAYIS